MKNKTCMPEMQSKKLAGQKVAASTAQYLDIAEIKEDVVILKDGSLRAVLAVSSVNFALKSEEEQNAMIAAYSQFLNSLEHPLQIVIQSRKLDIDGYLSKLDQMIKTQTNELLRAQTIDYRNFVKELVELGEIMTKRFYVVVPYSPVSDKRKNFWVRLLEALQPTTAVKMREERFRKARQELMLRVDHVMTGLSSIGLKSVLLDTQSLIELFYSIYNLDIVEQEKLVSLDKIRVE